jgi:hypothetical protein
MMQSLPLTTMAQLDARLNEQISVVSTLRLAVDIQAMRIAHMQPELFAGSHRRQSLHGLWRRARAHRCNGRIES